MLLSIERFFVPFGGVENALRSVIQEQKECTALSLEQG